MDSELPAFNTPLKLFFPYFNTFAKHKFLIHLQKINSMKKIILIALFAFFAGSSFGQTLIETNKMWNIVDCTNFGPCYTSSFKFEGDTILNGINYKKLMESWNAPSDIWTYHSAFREDETGKVYGILGWEIEEQHFYDFDLEPGDDFNFFFPGSSYPITMHVTDVDSVTLLNGEKRKRITFDNAYDEQWIEGIGSTVGIPFVAYYWNLFDLTYELNCFYIDDELIYKHGSYETCWFTTVGIDDYLAEPTWMVSPNPFDDTFTIQPKTNHVQGIEVRISNLQGAVLETHYHAGGGKIMAGKNLEKGFYLLQIFENGKLSHNSKLVKQ